MSNKEEMGIKSKMEINFKSIRELKKLNSNKISIDIGNFFAGYYMAAFLNNCVIEISIKENNEFSNEILSLQKKYSDFEFGQRIFNQFLFDIDFHFLSSHFKILLFGSHFQLTVWKQLKTIGFGKVVSYSDMANKIQKPKAVRAVATAIAKNPISYFIPCHRVVRRDFTCGGYRWGESLKIKLLAHEGFRF